MSSFTDKLYVCQIDGCWWQTTREFEFWYDVGKKRYTYVVPDKFKTDFASIPRLLWPVIGHPAGEYAQAAVLHDYLYRFRVTSRSDADAIFLEGMRVLGVGLVRRRAMWAAVRTFGMFAWSTK